MTRRCCMLQEIGRFPRRGASPPTPILLAHPHTRGILPFFLGHEWQGSMALYSACEAAALSAGVFPPRHEWHHPPGASRKENRNIWHNNVATSTRYVMSRRAPMDVRTV